MAEPKWLKKAEDLLGLYEVTGTKDNPIVLAMAKICGGKIAKTYKHDSIPWCAMFVNYILIVSDLPGNDSLWALDFRKYGFIIRRPALGSIATMTRDGGGHTFFVIGKTKEGKIVGRGGNQNDRVSDALFSPSALKYNWPIGGPKPIYELPIISISTKPLKLATMSMIEKGDKYV